MTPLRAFLMLRDFEGAWQVQVYHELSELVRAWEQRQDARMTAVVHIGFERPPTRLFDAVALGFEGQVLLTASARYALPESYKATRCSIAEIDGKPIFLATCGWGYEASVDTGAPALVPPAFEGWVARYVAASPDVVDLLLGSDIQGDASYWTNEVHLPHRLRLRLGIFRSQLLAGADPDPCALARAAPPWLQSRTFSELSVTVRIGNVFARLGITKVADLAKFTLKDLLQTANFGRTSVADLVAGLNGALQAGPPGEKDSLDKENSLTLLAAIRLTLVGYGPREQDILARRMGLDGKSETLAEIGVAHNITRERVRQIEEKVTRRIVAKELWDDRLTCKLESLLSERIYPLPLLGIEALDPWFDGIAERSATLRYLLANISRAGAAVIDIDGLEYLAFIDQDQWAKSVTKARLLLMGGTGKSWTEDHCRHLVAGLLPPKAMEFQTLLWRRAAALCHFTEDTGQRVLRAYGRGAEQVVETVLEDAEAPLHYIEIAERVFRRSGRRIDLRLAHKAAAGVGLLFGRGTYGLRKHLALSNLDLDGLADRAEDLVALGPPDRQWHCNEMIAMLADQGWAMPIADKYALDIVLCARDTLQSLGRMVWVQPVTVDSDAARIDVRQAVIATLQSAGRPLRGEEIRQRLIASRGVDRHLQIPAGDPMLRVAPATWGLNDRDVAIKRSDQPALLNMLADQLQTSSKGVHISELVGSSAWSSAISPEAVFSLAAQDGRFRVSVGQYLFLRSWGEPRRETVQEAARVALLEQPSTYSYDNLLAVVQRRVGRVFERSALSRALQALGASQDGSGWWRLSSELDELICPDFEIADSLEAVDCVG